MQVSQNSLVQNYKKDDLIILENNDISENTNITEINPKVLSEEIDINSNESKNLELNVYEKSPLLQASFEKDKKENNYTYSINIKSFQKNQLNQNNLKNNLKSINYLKNTISQIALDYFNEIGLNPEKIQISESSSIVEKCLIENTSKEVLENKENTQIKVDIKKLGISEEEYYKYAVLLSKFNLPITSENLLTLKNVENKIDNLPNLSNNSILYLLKNKKSISFKDLYVSKYLNLTSEKDVTENIDELINNFFYERNIPITSENLNIAKSFIQNEIDITKENLEKYTTLLNIKEFINKDYILENATLNIIKNKKLDSLELFENSKNDLITTYQNAKKILPNINTEYIQSLINKEIFININNLVNNYDKGFESSQISLDAVSKRLELAKIQMYLTQNAILKLSSQNIDITTEPLQKVIEQLEELQSDVYKESLITSRANPTPENIEIMKNTFLNLSQIYPTAYLSTFNKIINSKIDFSIKSISQNTQKVLETFSIFETTTNKSIDNLNHQFENLLKYNNLEINETNLRAAKILSLNNIDFSLENLLEVKIIDNKINYIHDKLHPLIVAKIIKSGINPSTENIDNLINIIDELSEEYSQTSREKIAEYILDIQNQKNITLEERNAIVAFYRILNLIEKNGSASIGSFLKTEGELTLKNLLNASNNYQKQKKNDTFDKKIDDNFGETIKTIIPANNIDNNIKKALNLQYEYNDILVKRIIDYSNPKNIKDFLLKQDKNLEDFLKEISSNENLNNTFFSKQTIINFIEKINNSSSKNTLNWLIENNIPITVLNIENAKQLLKNTFKSSKNIEKFNLLLKQNKIENISLDINLNFEKNIENLEQMSNNAFDEIINLNNFTDIKTMLLENKTLKNVLQFNKYINKIENGIYKIPIKLQNGKITDLNMYILNEENINSKNSINLYLNLSTKNLGNLKIYINISNNSLNMNISTNSNIKKLEGYAEYFKEILKEDFNNINIIFENFQENDNIYSDDFKKEFNSKIDKMLNKFNFII